jgi:hypothetical protein
MHPRPAAFESLPSEDIDNLDVRIAGAADHAHIEALAQRAGVSRPAGGLLVALAGERMLAATSIANRETVNEPTASGLAAAAVLRYRLVEQARRARTPRRAGKHGG